MNFKDLTTKRYSCRSFSEKSVEKEKLNQIIETAKMAPTGYNLQPYKIFVMDSKEAKDNVRANTDCSYGADTFLIVGYKAEEAFTREQDNRNFGDVDATLVGSYIMLATYELGLNTTWVANFDAPALKALYPEMKDYELIVLFPIGYAADDGGPADGHDERKDTSEVVTVL